ncbi:MAG TPA: hypothetical protein VK578_16820 [Edaphobacter sp.]|nr:hypothetical protein [Edaphobacter sp.]
MAQMAQSRFNFKRAFWIFLLAYLVVTVVATAFSMGVESAMHVTGPVAPMENPAYRVAQRFLPLLNLVVWMGFAGMYFKKRLGDELAMRREAFVLGLFWTVAAMVVDYVGFVLIKNPISLSPHDFYIGQFPWIYLIYVAVLVSPLCYLTLARTLGWKSASYEAGGSV